MPKTHVRKLSKKYYPFILGIGIPASLRTLALYVQQIIDTMYIGHYNSDSLVAISSVAIPLWLIESMWAGIASAGTVMVAQRIGAKKQNLATHVVHETFFLAIIFSIGMVAFWQYNTEWVVSLLNLKGTEAQEASMYILTLSWIYPFRLIGLWAPITVLEAIGKTRIIMWATLVQSGMNIMLNPLLIWGTPWTPSLGIQGAAIATVIAEIGAIIVLAPYFCRNNFLKWMTTKVFPIPFHWKERFTYGLPIMAEGVFWSLAISVIISMINGAIPKGGAIFNIGFLLYTMVYRVLYGFDTANISLMGRSYGATRSDRMYATLRATIRIKVILGALICITFYLCREPLIYLFTTDTVITEAILNNFFLLLIVPIFDIWTGTAQSSLVAMGYSRYNLFLTLQSVAIRVPLAYISLYMLGWGIPGVWVATIIGEGLRFVIVSIILFYILKRLKNKWISIPIKQVLEPVKIEPL